MVAPELEWIQMKKEFDEERSHLESGKQKMVRKIKENPLVPIGCLATFATLSYGLWSFRQGRRRTSQLMMRARIIAQGFTVVALMVGVAVSFNQKPDQKKQ